MSLKIKGSFDTEIYPTEGGYVAIKQNEHGEDKIIVLAAHQLPSVIEELQSLLHDRTAWEDGEEDGEEEEVQSSFDHPPDK